MTTSTTAADLKHPWTPPMVEQLRTSVSEATSAIEQVDHRQCGTDKCCGQCTSE